MAPELGPGAKPHLAVKRNKGRGVTNSLRATGVCELLPPRSALDRRSVCGAGALRKDRTMKATKPFRRVGFPVVGATVAALVLFVTAMAAAGATWTALAPLPARTEGMQAGVIGDKIVAAYGYSSGDTNLTRIYDISSNTWSAGAPAPGPVRSEGAAVAHGGNLYAIGGRPAFLVGSRLERYTVATDTWATLSPMPTARAGLGAAVVGDAIFAIGGRTGGSPCTGGALANVERYDIAADTWTAVAPLPMALSDVAAIDHGGRIFVFGGCTNGGVRVATVSIYDPTTDSWSSGAPMPRARAALYQVGKKGNEVYAMGGTGASFVAPPQVDVYNVSSDSWSTLPASANMPDPRGEMSVVSHGGRIYTIGGAHPAFGSSSATNAVLKP